jgi:hypothetical protein
MALVTTLIVLLLAGAVWFACDGPGRLQRGRMNAELASLVDGGTAELVGERINAGPQLVRVHAGRGIHGPFLDIDLGVARLHLRLYHDTRGPATGDQAVARLTGLSQVDGLGWVATFDGPRGPQRYLGWLVQIVAA